MQILLAWSGLSEESLVQVFLYFSGPIGEFPSSSLWPWSIPDGLQVLIVVIVTDANITEEEHELCWGERNLHNWYTIGEWYLSNGYDFAQSGIRQGRVKHLFSSHCFSAPNHFPGMGFLLSLCFRSLCNMFPSLLLNNVTQELSSALMFLIW